MYKYGLTFSKESTYEFPKENYIMCKILPKGEKYKAYVFYKQPLFLVKEHTYHLEYLGREAKI